jgi:hypothetical protein
MIARLFKLGGLFSIIRLSLSGWFSGIVIIQRIRPANLTLSALILLVWKTTFWNCFLFFEIRQVIWPSVEFSKFLTDIAFQKWFQTVSIPCFLIPLIGNRVERKEFLGLLKK